MFVLAAEVSHAEGASLNVGWALLIAAVLILLNGFFVAYEFAILAAKPSALAPDAEQGGRTAKAATAALGDLSMQLAGAQLGITIASLALGFVGEPALAHLLEGWLDGLLSPEATQAVGFAVALSIVVFLHLVVGEMVPKNIALTAPERTARAIVLPYQGYLAIFRVAVRFLNALASAGCRLLGVEPRDELEAAHSAAELAEIVTHSSQSGAIEADSAELLRTALTFAELPVGSVAQELDDIALIRLGATAIQAERAVTRSGQTRIPVVSPTAGPQLFAGYVHAKDLIKLDSGDRTKPLPSSLLRRMVVLRSDRSVIETLRVMRRLRRQVAVVVDDHNQAIGIATIEDVVRALLGHDASQAKEEGLAVGK